MKTKTTTELKTDINDQLFWDTRVISQNVNVTTDEMGNVVLTGKVQSNLARRAAAEDAWAIPGVKTVKNELEVEYPKSVPVRSSKEIEDAVNSSLFWDFSINSSDIEVSATAGVVTLEGSVDYYWKKIQAENKALDVEGVTRVINRITVVPTKDISDEIIAEDIINSIARKYEVDSDDVNVKVENGEATISGVVPNFSAWSAAYDSAVYTNGVKSVKDNLTIE